ncbi:MAG TPA: nucleotidyltransferase family protein [Clostridia bacterium]|nr:nucleotidyltransferase family protein [Clostridia bacterium]
MKLVCILMAAGAGKRFGSNKLVALYEGKPLYLRAMEAIPAELFEAVVVVTGCEDILAEAEERGFDTVLNDKPEEGSSRTIRLGIDRAREYGADAAMFMVCDQPRLKRDSVAKLIDDFLAHPERIALMADGTRRGNPAIFPEEFFGELYALPEDAGGSLVICRHEDRLTLHQIADPRELVDVDRREQLIIDN